MDTHRSVGNKSGRIAHLTSATLGGEGYGVARRGHPHGWGKRGQARARTHRRRSRRRIRLRRQERKAREAAGAPARPDGRSGSGEASPAGGAPKLDTSALELAAMLRADGERPRADGDLAVAVGLQPSEAAKRLTALVRAGLAVRVARNLHFDPVALETLTARIVAMCERDGQATIAGVRDELDTTRRYAQALLEHLDTQRITRRQGDAHVLRRR